MHFSDSAILRASSSIVLCVLPTLSWLTVKRAISSRFSMVRFFLSCTRFQAILLLLSAIAMLLIRFDHITGTPSRESDDGFVRAAVPLPAIWPMVAGMRPSDHARMGAKELQQKRTAKGAQERRHGCKAFMLVAARGDWRGPRRALQD